MDQTPKAKELVRTAKTKENKEQKEKKKTGIKKEQVNEQSKTKTEKIQKKKIRVNAGIAWLVSSISMQFL